MVETDRGQSEVLGYLFVFSILVVTVALVGTAGFAQLSETRDDRRVDNAERGVHLLADNVEALVSKESPSRATELELADSRLYLGDPVTVSVDGDGIDGPVDYSLRPIVYDTGSTRILLVDGAVLREQRDGTVLTRQPPLLAAAGHTVVPLITFESAGGDEVVGGSAGSAVRVYTARDRAGSGVAHATAGTVTVSITTPRSEAWARYFETQDCELQGAGDGDDTVSCAFTAERIHVTVVEIGVEFGAT